MLELPSEEQKRNLPLRFRKDASIPNQELVFDHVHIFTKIYNLPVESLIVIVSTMHNHKVALTQSICLNRDWHQFALQSGQESLVPIMEDTAKSTSDTCQNGSMAALMSAEDLQSVVAGLEPIVCSALRGGLATAKTEAACSVLMGAGSDWSGGPPCLDCILNAEQS